MGYKASANSTVELCYNAVLRFQGSDPRYIWVEGYNTVFPPHPVREWPVSVVDRLMNIFTIEVTIFCKYAVKDKN